MLEFKGLGFSVLGFKVWSSGLKIPGLVCRVYRDRSWDLGLRA